MTHTFDIQYFGSFNYYKLLFNESYVILDQYEPNKKTSFNNRCLIAGANGPILLSIPLEKGRLQTLPIKDIRISHAEKWQKKHWRSILSAYNASPWFYNYRDSLAELYVTSFTFLIDWNLCCLDWILQKMKVDLNYGLTSHSSEARYRNTERPGIGCGSDVSLAVHYPQVFENKHGFIPGLSILDLLFCTGPKAAVDLLKNGV